MITGYNHNIQYQGTVFHIQTEDSGLKHPHIISHLFIGGNILVTKKTPYKDLLESNIPSQELEVKIKEKMKKQHVSMLKSLKSGTFDEKIGSVVPKHKKKKQSTKHSKVTPENQENEQQIEQQEAEQIIFSLENLIDLLQRPELWGFERPTFQWPPTPSKNLETWTRKPST